MDSGEVIGVMKKLGVFLIGALLLMFVSGLLGGIIGYQKGKAYCKPMEADTIVVERIDTVTLVEVQVDTLIRFVNRLYPVTIHDTVVEDGVVYAELPYEYRFWSKPDTLDIWYSGVDPSIDSARIYLRNTTQIIRQPYEVLKSPRMTADVGVTAFYDGSGINPYLAGEMRYNTPRMTFTGYGMVDHQGRYAVGVGAMYRFNIIK